MRCPLTLTLLQKCRQLSNIRGDPPRLIRAEQLTSEWKMLFLRQFRSYICSWQTRKPIRYKDKMSSRWGNLNDPSRMRYETSCNRKEIFIGSNADKHCVESVRNNLFLVLDRVEHIKFSQLLGISHGK